MASTIKTISIIGSGNVAHHLGHAFSGTVKVRSVYSRNATENHKFATELFAFCADRIEDIIHSDLVLVCVNDDSINEIINQLPRDQAVAYTSGSVLMSELDRKENIGVIYPLQTFSKDVPVDLFHVPFFIEASDEPMAQDLFELAWIVSRKVIFANSEDRRNLHLAAVMVNNFTNHIHTLAADFLKSKSLEFDFLKPLIAETSKKLQSGQPVDLQTGPAKRNDIHTIKTHLNMLEGETKAIYHLLSESILKKHQTE
jgi:predicted short-subunit dehydrogenase-like oxidoreductase (DUF2520 family)